MFLAFLWRIHWGSISNRLMRIFSQNFWTEIELILELFVSCISSGLCCTFGTPSTEGKRLKGENLGPHTSSDSQVSRFIASY